jgi:hypothetical protein
MNFVDKLCLSVFVRKRRSGRRQRWIKPLIRGRLQNGKFYMLHALLTKYLGLFLILEEGRAIAQAYSHLLPTAVARVRDRSDHMGYMVDNVARGQVFSRVLRFPLPILILPIAPQSP